MLILCHANEHKLAGYYTRMPVLLLIGLILTNYRLNVISSVQKKIFVRQNISTTFTRGLSYFWGCPAVFSTASCGVLRFSGIPFVNIKSYRSASNLYRDPVHISYSYHIILNFKISNPQKNHIHIYPWVTHG